VHPETGTLTKLGMPAGNVWDTVRKYFEYYKKEPQDLHLRRMSVFSYWGSRLGLPMPDDLRVDLQADSLF